MCFFFCSRLIINVGQRVQLVHNDVDVVTSNAVALAGDALALVSTCNGVKFTAAYFALLGIEVGGNGIYACRVANKNHFVGQLSWTQVEVETRAVFIDDKLRGRKNFLCIHNLWIFS